MRQHDDVLAERWATAMRGAAPAVAEPPPSGQQLTREALRSRRVREVKPASVSMKRYPKTHLAAQAEAYPEQPGVDYERPKTRGDCAGGERPCPFVSCAYHLYLDVLPRTGAIKVNFPDLEVWELAETCALDVAERGGLPGSGQGEGAILETVGVAMNITRERVRQLEDRAHVRLRRADRIAGGAMAELADDGRERSGATTVLFEEEEDDADLESEALGEVEDVGSDG